VELLSGLHVSGLRFETRTFREVDSCNCIIIENVVKYILFQLRNKSTGELSDSQMIYFF
jgi:hypothetical protein